MDEDGTVFAAFDPVCAIRQKLVRWDRTAVRFAQLAEQAMEWFDRSMKLNPWGGDSRFSPWAGYGWCLDWLGRFDKSGPYFQRADQLDPKNYFIAARIGFHYMQAGNFAAARSWLERSLYLNSRDNDATRTYLEIINRRMLEAATNESRSTSNFVPH